MSAKENLALKARAATGLSQEAFSEIYRIPLGTLRNHEQELFEPTNATRAYYFLIAACPAAIRRKLSALPK